MQSIFLDTNTYITINKDPTKTIENNLKSILNRWKDLGFIDDNTKNLLRSSDSLLPRAYGIPKIHKINHPYRVIVSTIDSPLHKFSVFLHKILYKSIPNSPFFVKDSFELHNVLAGLELNSGFILASLDVVSLFTNVPIELACASVSRRWQYIKIHTKINEHEFINAIKFVMSSTYFTFNNIIYKQIFGSPMGSPLSPIIADITMQDIEIKALNRIKYPLPIYFRYVDDILIALPIR